MSWSLQHPTVPQTLKELREILLANRGLTAPQDIEQFFDPAHPSEITLGQVGLEQSSLQKVATLLTQAKEKKQKIVICGDYDVDGVCATAVLWEALHASGLQATPFIPDRQKHGYGLSLAALEDILALKPDVVITVDNGIVAHAALAELATQEITTIVTDHHQGDGQLPVCDALVHSTQLCGTTVAWLLSKHLLKQFSTEMEDEWGVELCGMATLADQLPVRGIGRQFVVWGLAALRQTPRPGLQALAKGAGIDLTLANEDSVQFGLAPRLNAAGRLAHAVESLRLLCTTSKERAEQLSKNLNTLNAQRQQLVKDAVKLSRAQLEAEEPVTGVALLTNELVVVAHQEFHEGVIGLIATSLAKEYSRPALAISLGEEKAKGSARSQGSVNITSLLREHGELFAELGGHSGAAGFTLYKERVEELLVVLKARPAQVSGVTVNYSAECLLPPSLLTLETNELLGEFAPFGAGNPSPLFAVGELVVTAVKTIGATGAHLQLLLTDPETGSTYKALYWQAAQERELLEAAKEEERLIEVLVNLKKEEWHSRTSLVLEVREWR
jgi:single-stranded-DNA-specific exonuclease